MLKKLFIPTDTSFRDIKWLQLDSKESCFRRLSVPILGVEHSSTYLHSEVSIGHHYPLFSSYRQPSTAHKYQRVSVSKHNSITLACDGY